MAEKRFSWMARFYQARDIDFLTVRSVDAYLLLRYLRLCVLLCFGGCVTLCPVLLSLNATGDGGMSQLNKLTIANVRGGSARLYAHPCCTMVYFAWVMYMVAREKLFYIELRHARFASNVQTRRSDSRTVLFTNVPNNLQSTRDICAVFGDASGLQVWLVTVTKSLRQDLKRRAAFLDKLDTLVTKYPDQLLHTLSKTPGVANVAPKMSSPGPSVGTGPTTIKHSRVKAARQYISEVERLKIDDKQDRHKRVSRGDPCTSGETLPALLPCAFVRFGTAEEAQIAYGGRHHDKLTKVTPRCVGTTTREIIWKNLGVSWKSALVRRLLSQVVILAMIVFWSFPVAFVTALTNIDAIFPDLRWQERAPMWVQRALDGFLPSLLLSLLMSLPPKAITLLGHFAGFATLGEVETQLQAYYFWFRIVQVFLVAALGSTASSVLMQVYADPSSTTTILAKRLPGASNFYLSYLVVQGLNESAFVLLNAYGLFSRVVLTRLLDDTLRKKLRRQKGCFEVSAATVSATCSSLLVIALCYAPAAPLMLCFATLAFAMFYLAHRHNLLFTADVVADTGGKVYATALQHTMVGVYLGELFLVGLLTIAAVDGRGAKGPLILAGALLACTVLYQRLTHESFKPWKMSVPGQKMQKSLRLQEALEQDGEDIDRVERSQTRLIWFVLDDRNSVMRKLAECSDSYISGDDVEDYYAPELTEENCL